MSLERVRRKQWCHNEKKYKIKAFLESGKTKGLPLFSTIAAIKMTQQDLSAFLDYRNHTGF